VPSLDKEIALHRNLRREYQKRYSPQFAQEYLEWWDRLITYPLSQLNQGLVLDCGCGIGYLAKKISVTHPDFKVIGLEPSAAMLALARNRKNLVYLVGSATSLPFRSSCFSAIICKEALHHVDYPHKALAEFYRVLRPGGILMLSDPCSDSFLLQALRRVSFRLCRKFNPDHGSFGADQMQRMLEQKGFNVQKQYRVGYLAYPLCGLADILPVMKFLPFAVFVTKILIQVDVLMSKIPFVNRNNWLIVTHAKK